LKAEVPLLLALRLGAFSVLVPELPVLQTCAVCMQRLVGCAAAAISVVRVLADSGILVTVFGMLTVKKPGAIAPRFVLVARPCFRPSKGRSSLW